MRWGGEVRGASSTQCTFDASTRWDLLHSICFTTYEPVLRFLLCSCKRDVDWIARSLHSLEFSINISNVHLLSVGAFLNPLHLLGRSVKDSSNDVYSAGIAWPILNSASTTRLVLFCKCPSLSTASSANLATVY